MGIGAGTAGATAARAMIRDQGGENLAVGTGDTGNSTIVVMIDETGSVVGGTTTEENKKGGITKTIVEAIDVRNGKIVNGNGMTIMGTRNSVRAPLMSGGERVVAKGIQRIYEKPQIG